MVHKMYLVSWQSPDERYRGEKLVLGAWFWSCLSASCHLEQPVVRGDAEMIDLRKDWGEKPEHSRYIWGIEDCSRHVCM